MVSRVQRRKLEETCLPSRYRGVHAAKVRTKKEEHEAKVLQANSNKAAREPFAARKLFGRTHAVSANKNVTRCTSRANILALIFCVLKVDHTVNV